MAAKARGGAAPKKPEVPVLSYQEKQNLERAIEADKSYLREVKGDVKGSPEHFLAASEVLDVNTDPIARRIRRNEAALEKLGPEAHKLTGAKRQSAEKECEELSAWLAARMLTFTEVNAFPSAKDELKDAIYRKALEKALMKEGEHSRIFIEKAERWKRLRRILEPENPEASSMDTIRLQGEKSGRHIAA